MIGEEEAANLCTQRMLAARYPAHMPVNFSEILAATLADAFHIPCPVFFLEDEARQCVKDAPLRRSLLERIAHRFPDPPIVYLYLLGQYDARGTPTQKTAFLVMLVESVRKRSNVLALCRRSTVRSSMLELEMICEGKIPLRVLGPAECSGRVDHRGHRTINVY
jgi:hypothetical protein